MLPLHTQKTLDQLTWREVQLLHSSLGLKATKATATRRDYQRRIVESQPQPIAEPEQKATALTCAICPLARHIDGDRYCCELTGTVTRGHWEARADDCYDAVVAQSEVEATETVAEVELPIVALQEIATESPIAQETAATVTDDAPPNRGDSGRRIEAATIASSLIDDNFMTAFTQESLKERYWNDLAYLEQLEMSAQIALERTYIGSEEEKIALLRLKQIERDIEFYNRPQPEPQSSPVIAQLQNQMAKLKAEVQEQFTIDDSILTVAKPKLAAVSLEPEGTIHWHGPLQGTIVGKKSLRNFYIKSRNCLVDLNLSDLATYEIMIVLGADFTAAEFSRPNIRHQQIRSAIVAGRSFNPRDFKNSEEFLTKTEDYCGRGRVMEHADGRWWAWSNDGVTGQPFSHENLAQKYLNHVADRRKLPACAT